MIYSKQNIQTTKKERLDRIKNYMTMQKRISKEIYFPILENKRAVCLYIETMYRF